MYLRKMQYIQFNKLMLAFRFELSVDCDVIRYHLKHIFSPCQDTCMLTSVNRINIDSNLLCFKVIKLHIIHSTKGVVELIVGLVWWMANNMEGITGA